MEILKSILDIKIPQILYHYTDANAFAGIITKKEIWASHIRFMNDYTEFKFAIDKFKELIEEFIKGKKIVDKTSSEEIIEKFETLIGKIDVFIFSLSEKKDELNQWRAYGKSIPNYSLAFNENKLVQNASIISTKDEIIEYIERYVYKNGHNPISKILLPCIYDGEKQNNLLKEILEDSYKKALEKKDFITKFTEFISKKFIFYAPLIKNKDYIDEKEWRIVVLFDEYNQYVTEKKKKQENKINILKDDTDSLDHFPKFRNARVEKIEFRSNGSYFIPYYKLDLKNIDSIQRIYIGACPDYDTVYESVEYMLRKNGIDYNRIKDEEIIQKSKLAYRNW